MGLDERLQTFSTRAIAVFVAVFSAWFILAEREGLLRFLLWLLESLSAAPRSLEALINYYLSLPAEPLVLSLGVGGLAGGAVSYLIWQNARRDGRRTPNWLMGMALGIGVGMLGAQIAAAATQHCTYKSEAAPAETVLGVFLTALTAIAVLLPLWTLLLGRRRVEQAGSGYFRNRWLGYVLLAPTLLSLLVFLYYPSVQMFNMSLMARRFPIRTERFVCLGNYISLLNDIIYQNSLLTTFLITIFVVAGSMVTALAIAVLASQKVRGAGVYRTLLIFPFALSPVVSAAVFQAMFREGGSGLINYVLDLTFGIQPAWLRDAMLARLVVVFAAIWNILGFNIIFYVAGLQNVPRDLQEAAAIDGANRVQRFFRIVLPMLAPYTFFLLVTNVTYAFYGIYGAIDMLTQGGPPLGAAGALGGATNMLIYKLYEDGFRPGAPIGSAAAQAVYLFSIVAALTVLQFRTIERNITYGG
ncbi:MAG: sugar ABC transporter permease [Anaerolineae bacterium]|nr:sugar ABC transporter permease [Anaerolineae bacterium]MDW8298146.1 sugar ABC transporter permease [Anaerolineae bacterium]